MMAPLCRRHSQALRAELPQTCLHKHNHSQRNPRLNRPSHPGEQHLKPTLTRYVRNKNIYEPFYEPVHLNSKLNNKSIRIP